MQNFTQGDIPWIYVNHVAYYGKKKSIQFFILAKETTYTALKTPKKKRTQIRKFVFKIFLNFFLTAMQM